MMKKGLFAVMALLIVFAMIGCDNGSNPGPGPGGDGFVVPTDWVRFTETEMLAAQFYIAQAAGAGYNPAGTSITKNADGSYKVTLKTVTSTNSKASVVWVEFADKVFRNGWYASLALPTTGGNIRPTRVDIVPVQKGKKGSDGDVAWQQAQDSNVTGDLDATKDGDYVVGNLSMHWGTEELQLDDFIGLAIWLTWAPIINDGEDYTFTIKDFAVLPHDTSIVDPDPNTFTAWTPTAVAEPSGYVNFPGTDTLTATYYPWATGTTGTSIVAAKPDSGRTLVRLSGDTFAYKKGIYISINLPNNSFKPEKIYLYGSTTKLEGGINYETETGIAAPAGKFIAGKVDLYWDGSASINVYQGIILDIYWYGKQEAGTYSFTINSIKVAEASTEAPPAEKPGIHDASTLVDATYSVGATAARLSVVPVWTANSSEYVYEWWKAESATADWPAAYYKYSGDGTNAPANQGVYIIPPTDVAGISYYYCVITFGSEKTLTRIVTITVN